MTEEVHKGPLKHYVSKHFLFCSKNSFCLVIKSEKFDHFKNHSKIWDSLSNWSRVLCPLVRKTQKLADSLPPRWLT